MRWLSQRGSDVVLSSRVFFKLRREGQVGGPNEVVILESCSCRHYVENLSEKLLFVTR